MSTHVLGIRHHGPGSARAVRRTLEKLRPDLVLIEGPPEADELIPLVAHERLRPPVALLAYPVEGDAPVETGSRAAFWPFAVFSPEWQAMHYAVTEGAAVRFFDLPVAFRFAEEKGTDPEPESARIDPIGALADAAGYDDPERWWEDVIEHRRDGDEVFSAVAEAMTAVRTATGYSHPEDLRREAYMRTALRAAVKEGHETIAIVCGAWHVPALIGDLPSAAHDAALLKGLSKAKVAMTWVPWTHGRLASWQGYGAGVSSPGWYHHLFTTPDQVIERWLIKTAVALRRADSPASTAHVIEGVRLAEALATLRGRPFAGLAEVTEATRAVLCEGDEMRLELIRRKLIVGERLGGVPDESLAAPLLRDVASLQRKLRMPAKALEDELKLDLRKPMDLGRSHLLHRLRLLKVEWGKPAAVSSGAKGTFWENWKLAWQPEFTVDLIAASAYGVTVAAAAAGATVERAAQAPDLATITGLVESCLLAGLNDALPPVLVALDDRIALGTDVLALMAALPPLARSLRYGDVRGTDAGALRGVTGGLVTRICVGLSSALTGLDETAAREVRERLDACHSAVTLIDEAELTEVWRETLAKTGARDDLPGLISGRVVRLLRDCERLDADDVALRLGRTLTIGEPPARAAGFIEGFFSDGATLLIHDDRLLLLVDRWLSEIPADSFLEVLPLVRRTFGAFAAPERRTIGERARHLHSPGRHAGQGGDEVPIDLARADAALPTLALLLGLETR
ncbi:hypothetical protein F4553_004341 [Allocatelliglobosispora scoriae]|uniref:Uncharacterized protein n=1 Tax=Allocatelliglobosispora scoriae TaxID=643052 RepID=A0A841BW21_9ACTN|nr:DUF5682 family protein [Allocatelliglobosispora scoriae]MBB5870962.1 hypothetical protein [Allocatelliglobosispora scoriae]